MPSFTELTTQASFPLCFPKPVREGSELNTSGLMVVLCQTLTQYITSPHPTQGKLRCFRLVTSDCRTPVLRFPGNCMWSSTFFLIKVHNLRFRSEQREHQLLRAEPLLFHSLREIISSLCHGLQGSQSLLIECQLVLVSTSYFPCKTHQFCLAPSLMPCEKQEHN